MYIYATKVSPVFYLNVYCLLSTQPVCEAQQLSNSIDETLPLYNNQPMALYTGSVYKQGQVQTSSHLMGETKRYINRVWRTERQREIWLRLFIAHERKQRRISEPNRKTHLKNSVKRIRSITSELSIMEANKLTGN